MDLNKEKHRININNYSFQEYCLYFHQYNNRVLCIETSMGIIEVKVEDSQLPHLIGLQYAYDKLSNKKNYRGINGYNLLKNNCITVDQFKNRIQRNRPEAGRKMITWNMILARIEWLPYLLNNISKKPRLRQNQKERLVNSSLRGDYFYFKVEEREYLILSILKIKRRYTLESFIVYDDIRYLGELTEIEVYNVFWKE